MQYELPDRNLNSIIVKVKDKGIIFVYFAIN